MSRTRHNKIWHDHSEVASHGHLLVLVSAIYDPAFFYTSDEMKEKGVNIDVTKAAEQPHVYILARSRSSLREQAVFHKYRSDDLHNLKDKVALSNGVTIEDKLRYFYGDEPAQQVEAGSKQGGYYPCVGCTAKSTMFDDIAYSYRCNHMTVADRQKFVLKGQAWKQQGVNPLDDLRVNQLRAELEAHGETTEGKKKPELEGIFFELQAGICNVPALLQHNPTASLSSLHYEICPTEPLHYIKGHLANVISEMQHLLTGNSRVEYEKAIAALLSKETLRASDYRKAAIVLYSIMFKHSCNADLINVLRTATEITEILYAPPSNRRATTIPRLHNVCFEHGMLCAKVFSTPRTLTRRADTSIPLPLMLLLCFVQPL